MSVTAVRGCTIVIDLIPTKQAVTTGTDITISTINHSVIHNSAYSHQYKEEAMAALPSAMRRSVAALSSAALKAPACQNITKAFPRASLSATNRGITSLSSRRGTIAPTNGLSRKNQNQDSSRLLGQIRWNSDESGSLRQWGFEDVCAINSRGSWNCLSAPCISTRYQSANMFHD